MKPEEAYEAEDLDTKMRAVAGDLNPVPRIKKTWNVDWDEALVRFFKKMFRRNHEG